MIAINPRGNPPTEVYPKEHVCMGPLLFAILVNPLLKDWNGRLKFVDDTTALEVVPRCSPSVMPLVVDDISQFSSTGYIDLITIYCSVIRFILEYASPVWAALPDYLSLHLESVQKRAHKIIFPDISYNEALQTSKLKTLECRRDELCRRFINSTRKKACKNNPVYNIIRPFQSLREHDFFLRRPNSSSSSSGTVRTFTERFDNFITIKYT